MPFFLRAFDPHVLHVGKAFGQVHALAELLEPFLVELAGDLHVIDFLHAMLGMRQPVGQLAVVRDEDQSLARHVEAADAVDPRRIGRQ